MLSGKVLGIAMVSTTLLFVGCSQAPTSSVSVESSKGNVVKVVAPKFSDMAGYVDFVINNPSAKDFLTTSVPVGFKFLPTGGDKTKKMNFASGKTDKFVALYSDYSFNAPGGGSLNDAMNFYLEVDGNFYGPFVGTVDMTQ